MEEFKLYFDTSQTKPAKIRRKQESCRTDVSSYVETFLVQLCRGQNNWGEVIRRCYWYPEEADLFPVSGNSAKLVAIDPSDGGGNGVYRETALGIVCASRDIGKENCEAVVKALINANPKQVGASQLIYGHTAIRDAILNGNCTGRLLRVMVEAALQYEEGSASLRCKDRNGLSLLDHLIISVQLGSSSHSIAMMQELVLAKSFKLSTENQTSPLIRLLTMGNSFHSVSASDKIMMSVSFRKRHQRLDSEHLRSERVLKVTKLLLDEDPNLIFECSRVTGCAPLHIALRNYGSFAPLIQELLKRDISNKMMDVTNLYGDLPLHVACSVGAPLDVLQMIVERTTSVTKLSSVVAAVDLEWIHHIESVNGLYNARTFHPLEATGMRKHCFKQDEYYAELLKESVDQVMGNFTPTSAEDGSDYDCREAEAKEIFGCLLDRISLLIRAAASPDSFARLTDACKLCVPYSATLPLPILELFLWLRPEDVLDKDKNKMLPIHHAVRHNISTKQQHRIFQSSPIMIDQWRIFVLKLLDVSAIQCQVKCQAGRLPLHYALDHSIDFYDSNSEVNLLRGRMQSSRHDIIEKLIKIYPESVNQRDPISGLYPFMMALMDRGLSTDTTYCLLRRSPSLAILP